MARSTPKQKPKCRGIKTCSWPICRERRAQQTLAVFQAVVLDALDDGAGVVIGDPVELRIRHAKLLVEFLQKSIVQHQVKLSIAHPAKDWTIGYIARR